VPANILNLPDFKVVRVEEADHDYHVYAEVQNPPGVCTACGSDRLIGHGRNEQVIRDLPTHGKRLAIYVDTRRWVTRPVRVFMDNFEGGENGP
jgi:transposase